MLKNFQHYELSWANMGSVGLNPGPYLFFHGSSLLTEGSALVSDPYWAQNAGLVGFELNLCFCPAHTSNCNLVRPEPNPRFYHAKLVDPHPLNNRVRKTALSATHGLHMFDHWFSLFTNTPRSTAIWDLDQICRKAYRHKSSNSITRSLSTRSSSSSAPKVIEQRE